MESEEEIQGVLKELIVQRNHHEVRRITAVLEVVLIQCLEHRLLFHRLHIVIINHSRRIKVLVIICIRGFYSNRYPYQSRHILEGLREQSHEEQVLVEDCLDEAGDQIFIEGHLVFIFECIFRVEMSASELNGGIKMGI
jgi:hypothetical protein